MSFRATLGARNPWKVVLLAVFKGISRRKLLEMTFFVVLGRGNRFSGPTISSW